MSKKPPNGTFIEVPSAALIGELNLIGEAVVKTGGQYFELSNQGREFAFVLRPPRSRAEVRIYTSVARGSTKARTRGRDAIRLFWGFVRSDEAGTFKPLCKAVQVNRTAPRGEPDARLQTFLKRFRGKVREVYKAALRAPKCALCGAPMVERSGPSGVFLGCAAYPDCKGSRSLSPVNVDVPLRMAGDTIRPDATGSNGRVAPERSTQSGAPSGSDSEGEGGEAACAGDGYLATDGDIIARNMQRIRDNSPRDVEDELAYLAELSGMIGHATVMRHGMPNGEMAQAQIEDGLAAELDSATFFDLPIAYEGGSAFAQSVIAGDRKRKGYRG